MNPITQIEISNTSGIHNDPNLSTEIACATYIVSMHGVKTLNEKWLSCEMKFGFTI